MGVLVFYDTHNLKHLINEGWIMIGRIRSARSFIAGLLLLAVTLHVPAPSHLHAQGAAPVGRGSRAGWAVRGTTQVVKARKPSNGDKRGRMVASFTGV